LVTAHTAAISIGFQQASYLCLTVWQGKQLQQEEDQGDAMHEDEGLQAAGQSSGESKDVNQPKAT